jgi:hypothetical protein
MDGRVQLPVIHFMQQHTKARYVDTVTEPGPVLPLSQPGMNPETE